MASRRKKCSICLLVLGVLCIVLSILCFTVVPIIVREEIIKNTVLLEGSLVYPVWKEPEIPIYMQFYVFNLTNPQEVIDGTKKPAFEQAGPYSYREKRVKFDILNNDNGTVTYKQNRTWYFERDKSSGDESDTFTTLNLPLLSVAESLTHVPDIVKLGFDFLATLNDEELFMTTSVRNLSFGYHDRMMAQAHELLPDWFYTDYVGIYGGKNFTDDGTYTIYTGETDWNLTGVIQLYNGSTSVSFWTDHYANMVNGSDGTVAPPFITKDMVLPTFQSDVCRSLYGVYGGNTESPQGIPLWNFVGPREELASAEVNPNNQGFCTPKGNCLGSGLMNLTNCQAVDSFQIPIIASFPHFLYADEKYLDAVTGLSPVESEHRTEVGVEPQTGIVMKVAKRLQINAWLEPIEGITNMANLNKTVFPILWVNESAVIDDALANQYTTMMLPVRVADVAKYVLLVLGILLTLAASIDLIVQSRKKKRVRASIDGVADTDPLLRDPDPSYGAADDGPAALDASLPGPVTT